MKVACNFCLDTATGTLDQLIDREWARAVIYAPVRTTLTACPLHHEELRDKMMAVLGPKFKKAVE
jgi:hypothetical protein